MRKSATIGLVLLVSTSIATEASAAGAACAGARDVQALRTAAVQQQLMVAALSCDAASLYNQFVMAYRKELQASDKALETFFRRLNARTGAADYHAYKTRMANTSSMQSIGDMTAYCASAKAAFDAALNSGKQALVSFVSTQTVSAEPSVAPCETITAGLKSPPENVPLPRLKPVETVLPAQGSAIAAPN